MLGAKTLQHALHLASTAITQEKQHLVAIVVDDVSAVERGHSGSGMGGMAHG